MGLQKWSRGVRVAVYAIVGVLTIVFMIAYLGGTAFLIARCEDRSFCSHNAGTLLELLAFALIAAIIFPWITFLTRVLRIKGGEEEPCSAPEPMAVQQVQLGGRSSATLSFGQSRVSGNVHSVDVGRHCITVGGIRLRFWGGYALRNRWIKAGDRGVFVYQRLSGVNFVLAFWKGGDAPLQGVGGIIHTFFFALAIASMGLILALGEAYPMWFMPVCGMLFVVSSAYLWLHFFAKRALRDFINSTISN